MKAFFADINETGLVPDSGGARLGNQAAAAERRAGRRNSSRPTERLNAASCELENTVTSRWDEARRLGEAGRWPRTPRATSTGDSSGHYGGEPARRKAHHLQRRTARLQLLPARFARLRAQERRRAGGRVRSESGQRDLHGHLQARPGNLARGGHRSAAGRGSARRCDWRAAPTASCSPRSMLRPEAGSCHSCSRPQRGLANAARTARWPPSTATRRPAGACLRRASQPDAGLALREAARNRRKRRHHGPAAPRFGLPPRHHRPFPAGALARRISWPETGDSGAQGRQAAGGCRDAVGGARQGPAADRGDCMLNEPEDKRDPGRARGGPARLRMVRPNSSRWSLAWPSSNSSATCSRPRSRAS